MAKTILFIEDNPLLTGLYKAAFEKKGVDVLVAHNGQEGIELVKEKKPSLVVLDFLMAGMNGFEVLEALKKDPATKEVKVVMLTVSSEAQHQQKAKELGAAAYLIKSELSVNQIVDAVEQFL